MNSLRKKPSLLRSAFFVLAIGFLLPQAEGAISCAGNQFADSVSRAEVSGVNGGGPEQSSALSATQNNTLINQRVDLNISFDINAMSSGLVVAESADWVWQLSAENKDKLKGSIVADYQFNSMGGPDKICSSSNSCLDILNVQTNVAHTRRKNGRVIFAEGRVILTLDLSQAIDAGAYKADVTISLHHNSTANPSLCP
ncbi:hypothetical protein [Kangiella marina]|uniref:Uncharacterized protein n=1 Tax=Kangiella marina TaxID=1079178 RepID=A0ABP8IHE1_9GAMM